MLDKQTRTLIAQRLNQAEKQREQIRAISLDYPSITIEDAYAVQREWVEMKIAEGRVLKGHKIGLTYVSCSPFRVPIARLAAAQAAIREQRQ